uniref:Uncharacterized protein n=1 Tax=Aegilops tauschii subsp. strangulata TaxID=200361 RepID=A0A453G8D9_AEGTS
MVRVATFFGMTFGAFLFWESMDKVHVWIALHQDEKRRFWEYAGLVCPGAMPRFGAGGISPLV